MSKDHVEQVKALDATLPSRKPPFFERAPHQSEGLLRREPVSKGAEGFKFHSQHQEDELPTEEELPLEEGPRTP